ncbi:class A sortase (plasmid) [Lactobacillus sp. PV037]|uniref:class A sortase n=1 Tax=Lactobacillus sp. PV037 TaxID=2594496 RepID=UPI00223FEA34|nr:class A sortase [Lactobacillus sp. PV037]QNQ82975.1 class A sortase [Lactobacillus sp. PV037]
MKKLGITFISLVFIGLGCFLLFNNKIQNNVVHHTQQTALHHLNKKRIAKNEKKKGQFDYSKVKDITWKQVTRARQKAKDDTSTAYGVGAIAIPSVGLNLPIENGLSDDAMATGGCTMRADQVMGKGNYPLAGHYMTDNGALFSPVEKVQVGQNVYLTNLKNIYTYKVYKKAKVDPHAVWLVDNTKDNIVTLITCADGGVNRWAVRGSLVSVQKATKSNLKMFNI